MKKIEQFYTAFCQSYFHNVTIIDICCEYNVKSITVIKSIANIFFIYYAKCNVSLIFEKEYFATKGQKINYTVKNKDAVKINIYAVIVVPLFPIRLNFALSRLDIMALRLGSAVTNRMDASTLGNVVFAGKCPALIYL